MPHKLLRFHQVKNRTGLSRTTIWRLERQGEFPKRIQLSKNAVAWRESDIDRWIVEKTHLKKKKSSRKK